MQLLRPPNTKEFSLRLKPQTPYHHSPPLSPMAATRSSDSWVKAARKGSNLAQDTLLDREVAFALIKTDGLDDTSRTHIRRVVQAMRRLGSLPPRSITPSSC